MRKKLLLLFVIAVMAVIGLTGCGKFKYDVKDDGIVITEFKDKDAESVVIPEKIKGRPVISVGTRTFWCCNNMKEITIPDSVTSIGDEAFAFNNVKEVTIPGSVTSIGDDAFATSWGEISLFVERGSYAEHWFDNKNNFDRNVVKNYIP